MKRIYEARNKSEFLKTVNNAAWYEWLFDRIFDYEHRNGKDLFDFNKDELLDILKDLKFSFSTLNVNKSYISKYIEWAIVNNKKLNQKNAATEITTSDLKSIATKTKVLHVDTIYEVIRYPGVESYLPPLKNYQDRLLVYLIFLGIRGDMGIELTNLRFTHIDTDNGILKLSEINPYRPDIRLNEFGIRLFKNTKNEKHYDRYMDITNGDTRNHKEDYELEDSDYVFRKTTVGRGRRDGRITYQGIMRRLQTISKYVGENLTMSSIERAGMTYIGKMIVDQGVKLTSDNPIVQGSIFRRYNLTTDEQGQWKVIRRLKKDIAETYNNES